MLDRKRLVFVFDSLHLGGSERQGLELASYLRDRCNWDVEVVGLREPGAACDICESRGIPWRCVEFHWSWPRHRLVPALVRFAAKLRACHPDVLLPFTILPNVVCGLIWRLSGAKSCIWNQRDAGHRLLSKRGECLAVRNVPVFVSNSQHGADFLRNTFNVDSCRLHVVRNGIALPGNTPDRAMARRILGIDERTFCACMIANLSPYKDHETLIRAWHRVCTAMPDMGSPTLLLAGADAGTAGRLSTLSEQLGILANVRFLGAVSQVSVPIAAADLCVHSSRKEGCPNGILECMANALPVVATDNEATRDALGPEKSDFLVKPGDPVDLARAIIQMIGSPSTRVHEGSLNRRRIKLHFSPEQNFGAYARLVADQLSLSTRVKSRLRAMKSRRKS